MTRTITKRRFHASRLAYILPGRGTPAATLSLVDRRQNEIAPLIIMKKAPGLTDRQYKGLVKRIVLSFNTKSKRVEPC